MSFNENLDGTGTLVSASENVRPKLESDDYSKPQTRVCSYKECGKTFTIPLDGDNGTLWYQLRGLFLPRRCPTCIKDGKKNWTPQSKPKQSHLTQNGSGIGPLDDPGGVNSLVLSMGSDLIVVLYSNDVQVGSSAEPTPVETIIHHSEYIVPNELHGVPLVATATPTAGPPDASSEAARSGCCGESDGSVDSSETIDGHPDACGFTVDSMLVHDCLLDTCGGLEIDPAAFDVARHAIRALMVPGSCAPNGSILGWNRMITSLNDSACAALFGCV